MLAPSTALASGYTSTAKLLHWSMAVLIGSQFAVAWTMPHIGRNTVPEQLINLHFSLGVLLLAVAAVRLAWRWTHAEPMPLDGVPPWQVRTAQWLHAVLYALLFVLPILGWAAASYRGFDVSFFGLFTLPPLLPAHAAGFAWSGDVHAFLSNYGLTAALGLHVAAALYHALIRKDRVLQRMLPVGWSASGVNPASMRRDER
jgi:cytochrome b561